MPDLDPLRHVQATVQRLARGLWFAYAGQLVDDITTDGPDHPQAWLEDAALLLLGGDLDHLTNLPGATELARLRTLDHASAVRLLCAAPDPDDDSMARP